MPPADAPNPAGVAPNERPTRVALYDEIYDPRRGTTVYRKTRADGPTKHQKKISKNNPILVVRRKFDRRGQPTTTEVDIKSQKLAEFLQDAYEGVEGLDLNEDPPQCNNKLLALSLPLINERLQKELASRNADGELVEALEITRTYVEEASSSTFKTRDALLHDREEPYMTFDLLWILFRPGRYLYAYDEDTDQGRILEAQTFEIETTMQGEVYAQVGSHIVLHDGKRFGKGSVNFKISGFRGAKKLRDLAVYPLDLYPKNQELRGQAVARGHKFVRITEQGCTFHEVAPSIDCNVGGSSRSEGHRPAVKGRVMIDQQLYRSKHGYDRINPRVSTRLDPTQLSDDEYMLCTPIVPGFSFTTKRWGGFALGRLMDVNWSNTPFDSLVLDPHTKALVRSMVEQHREGASNFDDIVQGKGRGLVGLLCGPPGCGKTLTAEAVAEATKSPLYTLSAGELGTSPGSVEEKLDDVLQLAERWKAVVLLDEADVFLAQRDSINIKRNALVSVFLRKLEYYQGILILTTNLITQCDVAFESRTHFTIHYPPLSVPSRHRIWNTFISQTSGKDKFTSEEIDTLSMIPLNGRQIKNCVAVAHSFATGENAQLAKTHVDTVLRVMRDWEVAKKSGQDLALTSSGNGDFIQAFALGAALVIMTLLVLRLAGWP